MSLFNLLLAPIMLGLNGTQHSINNSFERARPEVESRAHSIANLLQHDLAHTSCYTAKDYSSRSGESFISSFIRVEIKWPQLTEQQKDHYAHRLVELTGLSIREDTQSALVLASPKISKNLISESYLTNVSALNRNLSIVGDLDSIIEHITSNRAEINQIFRELAACPVREAEKESTVTQDDLLALKTGLIHGPFRGRLWLEPSFGYVRK